MWKQSLSILLTAFLLLTGCTAGTPAPDPEPEEKPRELLTITAYAVGDADALLLQLGDTAILIDTGEEDDGERLCAELTAENMDSLDALIITHYDKDHIGGTEAILDAIETERIFCPDYEGSGSAWKAFRKAVKKHNGLRVVPEEQSYEFGELKLEIYPALDPETMKTENGEYDNDLSLVVMVTYGSCRFLFTGDVEKARIREMLSSQTDWSCDLIKMPHHGRYQKALQDLLEAAGPEFAVICCSNEAPPEKKTLELLEKQEITCACTDAGNVVFCSDGTTLWIAS